MQKCCYFKIYIIFAIGCNKKDFYHPFFWIYPLAI